MQIETYEVEEIKGDLGTMAADSEAIELCQKLGLKGQEKLTNTDSETRNPFRKLTALEALVFGILFPEKTKVENYESGLIPLRVLKLLEQAKDSGQFIGFTIWHPEDVRSDPVLIGLFPHENVSYATLDYMATPFLLARWGEALFTFEALAKKAKEIWVARARIALKNKQRACEQELENIESLATTAFLTGKVTSMEVTI